MNGDLISRSALLEELSSLTITITGLREGKGVLREVLTEYRKTILRTVDEAPAVDAVEVCRCKDCRKMCEDEIFGNLWCNRLNATFKVRPDDFCSYGERRADE